MSLYIEDLSMSREFQDLLTAVKEYCELIESSEEGDAWLKKISKVLPRLHVAIAAFSEATLTRESVFKINLDDRFDLYSRLHLMLGDRDAYWMVFDVSSESQQMSGSLADDLTDIYCELKQGLRSFNNEHNPDSAVTNWYQGYKRHWGQHLLDAEKHLFDLSQQGQLAL
jgi:hypothetical protein